MKSFRVISDIHFELFRNLGEIESFIQHFVSLPKTDYLILAGDIGKVTENQTLCTGFPLFLDSIQSQYKKIFYVLGNHEYYSYDARDLLKPMTPPPKRDVLSLYRSLLGNYSNVVLLENELYEDDDGFTLYGTTLWSKIHPDGFERMNDSHFLTLEDYLAKHEEAVNKLTQLEDKSVDIIVTHHMPSHRFTHPKYRRLGKELNSAFSSDCEPLFSKAKTHWIFGHTHVPINRNEDQVQFICNPVGYRGENPNWVDVVFQI